jgi:hypothetical protein
MPAVIAAPNGDRHEEHIMIQRQHCAADVGGVSLTEAACRSADSSDGIRHRGARLHRHGTTQVYREHGVRFAGTHPYSTV